MIKITKHAEHRLRARLGIPKQAIQRMAEQAFNNGIHHDETTGKLNQFVSSLYLTYGKGNNIRIHHGYVYVFQNDTLITVFILPAKFRKLADVASKKRSIEDVKTVY